MKIPYEEWKSLSHRERRRHVNRERKRHRRMARSRLQEEEQKALEAQPGYLEKVCEEEKRLAEELRQAEAQSMLENAAWLERERIAQEAFKKTKELEEKRRKEKEERELLIRSEWEALQQKEKKEREIKDKERLEKEEKLKEALRVGEMPPPPVDSTEPWHNPIAPEEYSLNEATPTPSSKTTPQDYGTEKDRHHCSFFLKTGACRFGDRCSRVHPKITSSCTLLVPGMYTSLGLKEQMLNERDQDVALEYDESELYEDFRKFYDDVLPEFSKAGTIVQFKVSCNHEPHLRGNVYVQYSSEKECCQAFNLFNGRWYAQRQLSCRFCHVTKWKSAICGLFNKRQCPKGRNCNFLHVFLNPKGAFKEADNDLPIRSSSRQQVLQSNNRRNLRHYAGNEEQSKSPYYRNARRHGSRSPRSRSRERHQKSHLRSKSGREHGTKSRERYRRARSCSRSKSRERYQRARSRSRSKSRERYRRARSRSRSKSRERYGMSRSYSRSKSRERYGMSRSHSRSESRERYRSHSRSKSKERSLKHRKSESHSRHHRHHHSPHHRRSSSSASRSSYLSPDSNSTSPQQRYSKKKKKRKRVRNDSVSRHKKRHHHKSKKHSHHGHHRHEESDKDDQEVDTRAVQDESDGKFEDKVVQNEGQNMTVPDEQGRGETVEDKYNQGAPKTIQHCKDMTTVQDELLAGEETALDADKDSVVLGEAGTTHKGVAVDPQDADMRSFGSCVLKK